MWKKIKNSQLFLSFVEEEKIYVTDYMTLWFSYLPKTSFLRILKSSNILLEMSDEALLQKGIHMLSNPGDLKNVDMKLEDKTLVLNLTMTFGYPFKLTLNLFEGSKALFFKKITQPLMKSILELKSSQLELCELLEKKDSEIEEYKYEGGAIAIKHLKTRSFDKETFLSKCVACKDLFGSTNEVLQDLIQKILKEPEDIENMKTEISEDANEHDLQRIKVEASSQVSRTKVEPDSTNPRIKIEPSSQVYESQSVQTIKTALNVKQESQSPIKRESQPISPSGRKRMKKLNL